MVTTGGRWHDIQCPIRENCYSSFACTAQYAQRGLAPAGLEDYQKGDMIFYGQDAEQAVLNVRTGIAVVINYQANGEAVIIGLVGQGVMVGEMEAFFQIKYPYVIKMLTPVTVCKYYAVHLVQVVNENPLYLGQVIAAIENNDHALGRQLWVMNAQRVQERLRRQLAILANFQAFAREEVNPLPLTHDDLALLINTDRSTVSRCLKRLEEEGFVKLGYQSVTVTGAYTLKDLDVNFRVYPAGGNRSILPGG